MKMYREKLLFFMGELHFCFMLQTCYTQYTSRITSVKVVVVCCQLPVVFWVKDLCISWAGLFLT